MVREIEFEGPKNGRIFDEASAILLYRFTDPKVTPVGFGLMGEVAIGRGGRVTAVEARGIAEGQNEHWWLQSNAILRHAREGEKRGTGIRSEEHTSELQSLMRISYAVFCLKNTQNICRQ